MECKPVYLVPIDYEKSSKRLHRETLQRITSLKLLRWHRQYTGEASVKYSMGEEILTGKVA